MDGGQWSAADDIDDGGFIHAVSCASIAFCVATDKDGDGIVWQNGTWSEPDSVDIILGTVPCAPGNSCNLAFSVSCPATNFCMGVDDVGDALTYTGVNVGYT